MILMTCFHLCNLTATAAGSSMKEFYTTLKKIITLNMQCQQDTLVGERDMMIQEIKEKYDIGRQRFHLVRVAYVGDK